MVHDSSLTTAITSSSASTPYARHERHHMSQESKQSILKHSAMSSLKETTVPTVANAESLAVVSREVVRGSAVGGHAATSPLWNEYYNPSAQLTYA